MKRRDFLKILGVCVIAPGTAIAAVKIGPEQRIYAVNYPGSGVTDKQLRELIQATLKDLPQNFLEDTIFRPYREIQWNMLYNFQCDGPRKSGYIIHD